MEFQYEYAGKLYPVSISRDGSGFRIGIGENEYHVDYSEPNTGFFTLDVNGKTVKCHIATDGSQRHIFIGGNVYRFNRVDASMVAGNFDELPANITSPISGRVISVGAEPGARVEEGTVIMTIEAMKMEYQIKAPYAGKIDAIHFGQGDQVDTGTVLVDMEKED